MHTSSVSILFSKPPDYRYLSVMHVCTYIYWEYFNACLCDCYLFYLHIYNFSWLYFFKKRGSRCTQRRGRTFIAKYEVIIHISSIGIHIIRQLPNYRYMCKWSQIQIMGKLSSIIMTSGFAISCCWDSPFWRGQGTSKHTLTQTH